MKAVKWAVGLRIIYAWVLTLPVAALLAGIIAKVTIYIMR
jgi:phosphate/sulfate permease